MFLRALGWLLAVALAPISAAAQSPASVWSGQRIRVDQTDGTRLFGRLEKVNGDSIRLQVDGSDSLQSLSLQHVSAVAIRGKPNRWRGAGWGAAIGGLAGIVIVARAIDYDGRTTDQSVSRTAFAIPEAILLSTLTAGIGAAIAPETWSPLLTARRSAADSRAQVIVGLRVPFYMRDDGARPNLVGRRACSIVTDAANN